MEKREFNIEIFKWALDWWISIKDFDHKQQNKYESLGLFAKSGIEDKKLIYIFNNGIDKELIEICKEEQILKEIVLFTPFIDNKKQDSFEGTFIDALGYIQKAFNG